MTTAIIASTVVTWGAGHGSSGAIYPAVQFGSTPKLGHRSSSPVMSKLESIASSAVRAADKVQASLIIVYTHTGLMRAFCLYLLVGMHCFLGLPTGCWVCLSGVAF